MILLIECTEHDAGLRVCDLFRTLNHSMLRFEVDTTHGFDDHLKYNMRQALGSGFPVCVIIESVECTGDFLNWCRGTGAEVAICAAIDIETVVNRG